MAKITISGLEDKKPATGAGTSGGTGNSSVSAGANTGNTGAGTSSGTSGGNTGGIFQGTESSGNRFDFSGFLSGLFGGNKTNTGTATQEPAISPETRAETSIGELRNKYAQNLRNEYNYSAEKLKNERDAALRENWILQQRAEAALPEQMAASGINGGASETSLADLRARYQGNRNDIQGNYMENLGDLTQQAQSEKAENERNLNERWIEYLLSLAKANAGV